MVDEGEIKVNLGIKELIKDIFLYAEVVWRLREWWHLQYDFSHKTNILSDYTYKFRLIT